MTAEAVAPAASVQRSSLALIAASYSMRRDLGWVPKAINAGADRGRKEAG